MVNKMAISEFWYGNIGGKISVGGGLDALKLFWSLKKGTRIFHFRYNEPSCNILEPLGWYNHPWEKEKKTQKKQTNK